MSIKGPARFVPPFAFFYAKKNVWLHRTLTRVPVPESLWKHAQSKDTGFLIRNCIFKKKQLQKKIFFFDDKKKYFRKFSKMKIFGIFFHHTFWDFFHVKFRFQKKIYFFSKIFLKHFFEIFFHRKKIFFLKLKKNWLQFRCGKNRAFDWCYFQHD